MRPGDHGPSAAQIPARRATKPCMARRPPVGHLLRHRRRPPGAVTPPRGRNASRPAQRAAARHCARRRSIRGRRPGSSVLALVDVGAGQGAALCRGQRAGGGEQGLAAGEHRAVDGVATRRRERRADWRRADRGGSRRLAIPRHPLVRPAALRRQRRDHERGPARGRRQDARPQELPHDTAARWLTANRSSGRRGLW